MGGIVLIVGSGQAEPHREIRELGEGPKGPAQRPEAA
jgi:hypothetical protein